MSVSGLCQVCQSARAVDRCDRCGTLACGEHFDEELGFCVSCAAEYRRGEGDGGNREGDHPDVDRYEF